MDDPKGDAQQYPRAKYFEKKVSSALVGFSFSKVGQYQEKCF